MNRDYDTVLRKWVEQARKETPPAVDVAPSVSLSIRQQAETDEVPMMWFAGASMVCGAAAATYLVAFIDPLLDPLSVLFTALPGGTL